MKRTALLAGLFFTVALALTGQRTFTEVEGSWSGKIKTPAGELQMVLHFSMTEADTIKAVADAPDQGVKDIPCGRVTLTDDSLTVDIPAVKGYYRGGFSGDTLITGIWNQLGGRYDLILRKGVKPVVHNRPQEPKPPYPYREQEVTFMNTAENFSLAGTLTLPEGEGPFPAVVLISGSGQQDRDETVFLHKPFMVLADYLTRNGIAVLRYDDRGVGKSKGKTNNATSLSFADDAEAAVNYLLQRPEINKKKIGLAGHSEGGLIAPLVASRNSSISFIVSLAGPGVKGMDILLRQAGDIMKASGTPQSEIDETLSINSHLFSMVVEQPDQRKFVKDAMEWYGKELDSKGVSPEERKEKMTALTQGLISVNNPWMRYFIVTDPAQFWSKVKCPVLALNGEKDLQVSQEINLQAIKTALRSGGNRKVKTVMLPGLNHLFQTAETGSPDEYIKIEETFSPAAMELMTSWIKKTMKIK
jgi:alpha-beta hydrolase superfamily lysophospholipase